MYGMLTVFCDEIDYVCLVISTWMCRKYFRKYFEWYSIQNWNEVKKVKKNKFLKIYLS